ncbi:ribonuclease P protein component [Spiractinospora alimapuensis]|uniref:ribonuclease P protein component n=1 Tax=Spiractinospora alimapuensis TaxID=2820884 RepID=UPI0022AB1B0F|nr:ribonuclease P protein component [Spiractinospora alimapuensis]QVQ50504.1 ribonuclease P protein component [Spiractinospora alimapuensis]
MLPRSNRVRHRTEFRHVMRRGRHAGEEALVATLVRPAPSGVDTAGEAEDATPGPPRVGFVVGKAVGGAVVRNRVRRRLREIARRRLPLLPPGSLLVVRAKPAAARSGYDRLARQLDSALSSLLAPRRGRRHRAGDGHSSQLRRAEASRSDE